MNTYIVRLFRANRDAIALSVTDWSDYPPIRLTVNRRGNWHREFVGGAPISDAAWAKMLARCPVYRPLESACG